MEASAVYRVRYARALVVIPYLVPVGRRTYAVRRTIREVPSESIIASSILLYSDTRRRNLRKLYSEIDLMAKRASSRTSLDLNSIQQTNL
jgi:hypothetical protein